MRQLGEQLNITPDQQAQVKSMVEQETAELMQYACNFTTSQKDQVAQFRGVLTDSEIRMRPLLTQQQSLKLHRLDGEMLEEFKTVKVPEGCTASYWALQTAGK